jgi:hypothetical protein
VWLCLRICALWMRNDSRACAHLQARALARSRACTDSPRVQYAPMAGVCFPQRRACSRPRRLRSVNTSSAPRRTTLARPVLIGLQTQWYVRLRRPPRASRFGAPRQIPRTRRAATCGPAPSEPEQHLQNLRDQHLRDQHRPRPARPPARARSTLTWMRPAARVLPRGCCAPLVRPRPQQHAHTHAQTLTRAHTRARCSCQCTRTFARANCVCEWADAH